MFAVLGRLVVFGVMLLLGVQAKAAGPITYGTYYTETISTTCSGFNCRINFSQLPADKLFMLGYVSCVVSIGAIPNNLFFGISATSGGGSLGRSIALPFVINPPVNGTYDFAVNQPTRFLIGQARFPFFELFVNANVTFSITCTIIGDLVAPIQ